MKGFLRIFDGSMFVDFCITLEGNRAISKEELITFQHLVYQMLQCTLEETCQCWPNFLQALFFQQYHLEDAVCRRNKPTEAIIGIFRHAKLRMDEEMVDDSITRRVFCEVQSLPSKIDKGGLKNQYRVDLERYTY